MENQNDSTPVTQNEAASTSVVEAASVMDLSSATPEAITEAANQEAPHLSVVQKEMPDIDKMAAEQRRNQNETSKVFPYDVNDFKIAEIGSHYGLPVYHVVEGVGLQPLIHEESGEQFILDIPFVRGSKLPNGEGVEKQSGIVHEGLVAMMKADLEYKFSLVPSDETAAVLVYLTAIQDLFAARAAKRKANGTQGTYQK